MPNVFDQFDAQQAAPAANPFDQFDAPALVSVGAGTTAGAVAGAPLLTIGRGGGTHGGGASGSWDTAPPSTTSDVMRGIGSGLVHGAAAVPGFIADLPNAAEAGVSWLGLKAADKLGLLPPGETFDSAMKAASSPLLQAPPEKGSIQAGLNTIAPTTENITGGLERLGGPLYVPQTKSGQIASNVAGFIPAAIMGPERMATNAIKYGLIPGAASEGLGQAGSYLGPKAEMAGRIAGGMFGAGGVHALSARPADAILSGATRGVTDADVAAAREIQARARGMGIDITSAEAIQQATGNRSNLGSLQRNLEGMSDTAPLMADYFARRPQQVGDAANAYFRQVGPLTDQPSIIGANAQQEAQGAIAQVQGTINDHTRPLYDAARGQTVPPDQFSTLATNPAFANSVQRLRSHPVLGPAYADLPDHSIGVIDAATKDMYAQGEALRNSANQGFNPEAAAANTSTANQARTIARAHSPEYDRALQIQATARQQYLAPVQAGPLGQIGDTAKTMAQTQVLYPANPLAGSELETAQAVRMLPGSGGALTRQHLQTAFNDATQNLQTGANQWGGARFAAQTFGNPQQAVNLYAGIGALPGGARLGPDARALVEALSATGTRQQPGSKTAFNSQFNKERQAGTPVGTAASLALSPGKAMGAARDWYLQQRIGTNASALARALIEPQGIDLIEAARRRMPPDQFNRMMANALLMRAAGTTPAAAEAR